MKKFAQVLGVLVAVAALVVGVGIVLPETPVAGPAAEGAMTLGKALTGDDRSQENLVKMARNAIPTRTYYQYVDDNGRVQFAESLSDVPEKWRKRVGTVQMSEPPPTTPEQARQQREARAIAETAQASRTRGTSGSGYGTPQVTVYSSSNDESSADMLAWLDKKGYAYTEESVDNPASRKKLLEKSGRDLTPCFEINGTLHKGFSTRRFKRLYKKAAGK